MYLPVMSLVLPSQLRVPPVTNPRSLLDSSTTSGYLLAPCTDNYISDSSIVASVLLL